jgi:hypothetical protein
MPVDPAVPPMPSYQSHSDVQIERMAGSASDVIQPTLAYKVADHRQLPTAHPELNLTNEDIDSHWEKMGRAQWRCTFMGCETPGKTYGRVVGVRDHIKGKHLNNYSFKCHWGGW